MDTIDIKNLTGWLRKIFSSLLTFAIQYFVPSFFMPTFYLPVWKFEHYVKHSLYKMKQICNDNEYYRLEWITKEACI